MVGMSDIEQIFGQWLDGFTFLPDSSSPRSDKAGKIIDKVSVAAGAKPVNLLGSGDQGIAFKTDQDTVLKFTFDVQEARLWVQSGDIEGLAPVKGVYILSSSKTGNTIIYAVHVEYIKGALDDKQVKLIRDALAKSRQKLTTYMNPNDTPEQYQIKRTRSLIHAFDDVARVDSAFKLVPELLRQLWQRDRNYIYDLGPTNFRVNDKGLVVVIDPSVPDRHKEDPVIDRIMFEKAK